MTLVTVVIPVHNGADTILRAIESVLGQTHLQLHLVVVDDCSTDNTYGLVSQVDDARVTLLSTENQSGGPATPRNIGITHAAGEWIAFLDADDWWAPSKIEQQLRIAGATPAADIVYSRISVIQDGYKPFDWHGWGGDSLRTLPAGDLTCELLRHNCVPLSTAMVRRELFQKHALFDPAMPVIEDYDLWLRLTLAGAEFAASDETLACYSWHSTNISHARAAIASMHVAMFTRLAAQHPAYSEELLAGRDQWERKATTAHLERAAYSITPTYDRLESLFKALRSRPTVRQLRVFLWHLYQNLRGRSRTTLAPPLGQDNIVKRPPA